MTIDNFKKEVSESLENLFNEAKEKDEFAYIFSLLGINSGMQDAGWQPIAETFNLLRDIVSIVNTPLELHTRTRLLLMLYCQITEASYPYHVIYNMMLAIELESPPKVFNFLDLHRNGNPPSVKSKVKRISDKAKELGHPSIRKIIKNIFNNEIRNAISHADYILHEDSLRLNHKMISSQPVIKIDDLFFIINRSIVFFESLFQIIDKHKRQYPDGYVISNRKSKDGRNLGSITISSDEKYGITGFSQSDPLPIW